MIKLIACDIDGTLLQKGQTEVNKNVFKMIKKLAHMGVMFCPASGRQLHSLERLFEPVADKIYYICENGAIVFAPGEKVLAKTAMPRLECENLITDILATPYTEVLISGANTSYLIPKEKSFLTHMRDHVGNNVSVIKSAKEIDEDIIKISACCYKGVKFFLDNFKNSSKILKPVVSGTEWLDFTLSDKGTGMHNISKATGIPLCDMAAIGDNFNDVEMLEAVGHPYIMENAKDTLKNRFPQKCLKVEDTLLDIYKNMKTN